MENLYKKNEFEKTISRYEHEIEIENIRWDATQEDRELTKEEKYKINLLEHRAKILKYEIVIGASRNAIEFMEATKDES